VPIGDLVDLIHVILRHPRAQDFAHHRGDRWYLDAHVIFLCLQAFAHCNPAQTFLQKALTRENHVCKMVLRSTPATNPPPEKAMKFVVLRKIDGSAAILLSQSLKQFDEGYTGGGCTTKAQLQARIKKAEKLIELEKNRFHKVGWVDYMVAEFDSWQEAHAIVKLAGK
jgi:hypothetical protein